MATELWCVHMLGMDDVIAQDSLASARRYAHIINESMLEREKAKPSHPFDPNVWATPALWPHDAASHAADLARQADELARAKAAGAFGFGKNP
jgi:hypothetical protein